VTEVTLEVLAAQMERLLREFAEMRGELAGMRAAMLHIRRDSQIKASSAASMARSASLRRKRRGRRSGSNRAGGGSAPLAEQLSGTEGGLPRPTSRPSSMLPACGYGTSSSSA
jgi:hypothetical protein